MITREQLSKIMPHLPAAKADLYFPHLTAAMQEWEITTPLRMAAFLAQLAHESLDLTIWQENLNYSAEGLLKIFKRHFTPETAQAYQRNPEKIANRVYADRMGNGNEVSGDGWKFRGRGPIQATGKDMYTLCGKIIGMDLVSDPDAVLSPEIGFKVAGAIWTVVKKLNPLADIENIKEITRKINGGTIGLEDRVRRYELARQVLGVVPVKA